MENVSVKNWPESFPHVLSLYLSPRFASSICALWSLSYSPLVFNDHIFSSLFVVSACVHICVWVYLSCVEVKGPHYNVFLDHFSIFDRRNIWASLAGLVDPPVSTSQHRGCRYWPPPMIAGHTNSDTHACTVSTTPSETALQAQYALLKLKCFAHVLSCDFFAQYLTLQAHVYWYM